MRRKYLAVILTVAVLGALGTYLLISTNPSADLPAVRVGYMPIAECGPLFLGVDRGIFERHGLRLELREAPGGAVILDAVIGGGLDVGFSNLVSAILAVSQGLDLASFAGCTAEDASHQLHGLVVGSASSVRGAPDLRGQSVALNTLRNIDHLMLVTWLGSYGVPPADVRLVEVPFPRMEPVLHSGEVGAIAVVEPFLTRARRAGARVLGDYFLPAGTDRVEVATYCATRRWLASHAAEASAFHQGLREATQYANEHQQELRDAIGRWTNLSSDLTDAIGLPLFLDRPTPQGVADHISRLTAAGFVARAVSPEYLIWSNK
jgi:NitT/TauT family transport system substrate-binding protein